MLNYQQNAPGGFTPPLWLPKNVITPEQIICHHHSQRRGGMGGQALSLPSSYPCSVFHGLVLYKVQKSIYPWYVLVAGDTLRAHETAE